MDRSEMLRGFREIRDPDIEMADQLADRLGLDLLRDADQMHAECVILANKGDTQAQHVLSKLLFTGLLGRRLAAEAVSWSRKAAEQDFPPALVFLAGLYSDGLGGLPQNQALSRQMLEQAADLGFARAWAYLSTIYEDGLGVPRDSNRAYEYLRRAAELGDVLSQYQLGNKLVDADAPSEYREGVRWLQAAAQEHLPSAHRVLSRLYASGVAGLPEDERLSEFHRCEAERLEQD